MSNRDNLVILGLAVMVVMVGTIYMIVMTIKLLS